MDETNEFYGKPGSWHTAGKSNQKTMASLVERLPKNAPGLFFVDTSCTDCDLCRSIAPAYFGRDDETGFSFVHRQPVTPPEIDEAEEALQSCPSESIGKDGAV